MPENGIEILLYCRFRGCDGVFRYGAWRIAKKIEEKIDIAAKPEAVWAIISDFAKISAWNPAVVSSEAVSDP